MASWEWLYGRQAVLAALQAGRRRCHLLLLAEGVAKKGIVAEILDAAAEQNCPVSIVPRDEVAQRAGAAGHQGVALQASPYPYLDPRTLLQSVEQAGAEALVLILDHLEDPQNVGNLLRTAEVAGVTGVVLPRRRAAHITPAVVNASAGAVEYLDVAVVSNLAQLVASLQALQVWVYALEGKPSAPACWQVDLRGAVGLIVGSEGKGVQRLLIKRSDGVLRIPMWGHTSSLNAATAGAIALYEVLRQRYRNQEGI